MRYVFLLVFLVFSCGSQQSTETLKVSQVYASNAYIHNDSEGRVDTEFKFSAIDATTFTLNYTSYEYRPRYTTPDTVTQQMHTVTLTTKNGFTAYQSAEGLCIIVGESGGRFYFGDVNSRDVENCPQVLDLSRAFIKK